MFVSIFPEYSIYLYLYRLLFIVLIKINASDLMMKNNSLICLKDTHVKNLTVYYSQDRRYLKKRLISSVVECNIFVFLFYIDEKQ